MTPFDLAGFIVVEQIKLRKQRPSKKAMLELADEAVEIAMRVRERCIVLLAEQVDQELDEEEQWQDLEGRTTESPDSDIDDDGEWDEHGLPLHD